MTPSKKRVGYLIAGAKGASLLEQTHDLVDTQFICTLQQKDCGGKKRIAKLGAQYTQIRRAQIADFETKVDAIFVAGWPFLISGAFERYVMFHDSLLPKYRGFAPTIAALIAGEKEIGVTAFRPVTAMDEGPIYSQVAIAIEPPLRIADAYAQLAPCYRKAAIDYLKDPTARPQPKEGATYSLWRDELDYFLDWNEPTERLLRTVYALGTPYDGARTNFQNQTLILEEVTALPGLAFTQRAPGKIWRIEDGRPVVVTGDGLIRIEKFRTLEGGPFDFSRVRTRLGTPLPSSIS